MQHLIWCHTHDNDVEFIRHIRLRDGLGIVAYSADPYAIWQQESNENYNDMIHCSPLPAKTMRDRDGIAREVQEIIDKINDRSMKTLVYRTASEAFMDDPPDLQVSDKGAALSSRYR